MKKVGLFYGSSLGNTQGAAEAIAQGLGISKSDIFDVAKAKPEQLLDYEVLILGSSTWGLGDLQDDWEGFGLEKLNLSEKKVAVFGTGDSSSYSDTYCDAIGILAEAAEKAGATLIGTGTDTTGYTFDESKAVRSGTFCGLPLDEDNEPDQTQERINNWIERLKPECE